MRRAALLLFALPLLAPGPARASIFDFIAESVMSEKMAKVPGDTTLEKTRPIRLNGFPLFLTTGRTDKPVKDVLDFYQARYAGGALRQIVGKPVGVRREGDQTGTLMTVEVANKAAAMDVFEGRRTLASTGPLRLVYARRVGLSTKYLIAWSERPMPQEILEPRQSGDAPGEDIPGVPRPLGARSFSFEEPGAGYKLVMYVVPGPPDAALRGAAMRLSTTGWSTDDRFAAAANKKGKLVARFTKGAKDVVLTARGVRDDARSSQVAYLSRNNS